MERAARILLLLTGAKIRAKRFLMFSQARMCQPGPMLSQSFWMSYGFDARHAVGKRRCEVLWMEQISNLLKRALGLVEANFRVDIRVIRKSGVNSRYVKSEIFFL